jgi:hypothetical protein
VVNRTTRNPATSTSSAMASDSAVISLNMGVVGCGQRGGV